MDGRAYKINTIGDTEMQYGRKSYTFIYHRKWLKGGWGGGYDVIACVTVQHVRREMTLKWVKEGRPVIVHMDNGSGGGGDLSVKFGTHISYSNKL